MLGAALGAPAGAAAGLPQLRSLQAEAPGGLRLARLPEQAAWQMGLLGGHVQALHIVVVSASAWTGPGPAREPPHPRWLPLALQALGRKGVAHGRAVVALGPAWMWIFVGCDDRGAAWAAQAPCGCLGFPV